MGNLSIYACLALILSIAVVPALSFDQTYALKSNGNPLTETGSKKVCGDKLCSEVTEGNENVILDTSEMFVASPSLQKPTILSTWNDGISKQKIIEFVEKITNPSSPAFVPKENRIATFDNDGTLWIEQPLYIPFSFHLEYLYGQLEKDPSLSSTSPYKELLEKGDSLTNNDLEEITGLMDVLLTAYPEITQEQYLEKSKNYLNDTTHPRFDFALKQLTYRPMVELIHYLQDNNFQVYIVSAGFQGLMRSVSDEIYNIDKSNVIGTHPEFIYKITKSGPSLIRQPILASFNDGPEKPVNIQKVIGKVPIFACGNSSGDIEMLLLTHFHENRLGCMVNHDDKIREYNYPNSEALEAAKQNDWLVISMKNDFKEIFSNYSEKIEYECSSDFWRNNLDLWEKVGVDYNDDFDETFGRNYFEPDITLRQAISMEGLGMYHLARSGTAAYLNALADPEIDEETVRAAVNFGYIHQIDNYIQNCKNIKKMASLK